MARPNNISKEDNAFLGKLEEALNENLTNEQFGVEELSEEVGLSRSQVHRKLKVLIDKSVSQFIREFRLEKAMTYLVTEDWSISDVCF